MGHKPEPRRQGARLICNVCGYALVRYRATRLIRKAHYRHMTWQQGSIALRSPNYPL